MPEIIYDDEVYIEKPSFVPPVIQENLTGWGPCEMPEQFKDMPYQPFSKGDRLGKVSYCLYCLLFVLIGELALFDCVLL